MLNRKQTKALVLILAAVFGVCVGNDAVTAQEKADAESKMTEGAADSVKLGEIVVRAAKTDLHGQEIIGPAAVEATSLSATVDGRGMARQATAGIGIPLGI